MCFQVQVPIIGHSGQPDGTSSVEINNCCCILHLNVVINPGTGGYQIWYAVVGGQRNYCKNECNSSWVLTMSNKGQSKV